MKADMLSPDERELTRQLINGLSVNRRVKSFQFSQNDEAHLGADWLWIIITEVGVYRFLVQAKKLDKESNVLSRQKVGYKSKSGSLQIESLINTAKKNKMTPLYVIFSDSITRFQCKATKDTKEGVFFDSAENLYDYYFGKRKKHIRHMPISCMYACLRQRCNYKKKIICRCCKSCNEQNCCTHNIYCEFPFEQIMKHLFEIECQKAPLSDTLILPMFAESVIRKKPSFTKYCLEPELSRLDIVNQVVISDYMNRHASRNIGTILGFDIKADRTRILNLDFICSILRLCQIRHPVFFKIGIFGSYAKNTARVESDVDIALDYKSSIKTEMELQHIINFIKEVNVLLMKNVDFVDYSFLSDSAHFPQYKEQQMFKKEIDSYIIWV